MVGTGDDARAIAGTVKDAGAAMAADVVEGSDLPLPVADGEHAGRPELQRDEVAGPGNGIDVAEDLPAGFQDALVLETRHLGIVIYPGR